MALLIIHKCFPIAPLQLLPLQVVTACSKATSVRPSRRISARKGGKGNYETGDESEYISETKVDPCSARWPCSGRDGHGTSKRPGRGTRHARIFGGLLALH